MTRGLLRHSYAILILAGCATFRPGHGVTPDIATQYGCNYDAIVAQTDTLTAGLGGAQYVYIPKVGWDACNLLAHDGAPTRVEHLETQDVRAQDWWYQDEDNTHLVTLTWEPKSGRWFVTYVGW